LLQEDRAVKQSNHLKVFPEDIYHELYNGEGSELHGCPWGLSLRVLKTWN